MTGFIGAIGNTPHVILPKLSEALGRTIVGKAEFLNPGGSVKDRAAKGIVEDAEARGALRPGGTIVEGTAGNTGIALSLIANARGYRSIICIPDDQSPEKYDMLRTFGADLRIVPAAPFTNPKNYYHVAREIAEATPGAVWADQFNNVANRRAHYSSTGPETGLHSEPRLPPLQRRAEPVARWRVPHCSSRSSTRRSARCFAIRWVRRSLVMSRPEK